MDTSIEGVILTDLKRIPHPKGDIYHGLKKNEDSFNGFGESYFSFINYGEIKAWKRHFKMICNIVVPIGKIEFALYDLREKSATKGKFMKIELGEENYKRITIPPGIWYGFKGLGSNNMLHNLANIEHDPEEQENVKIGTFKNLKW
ncbi:dTDP-4-dehydrorhamnose 3,5-epimerase family protein [Tenacibaculum sp. SG-28]|uniref:dTDP-4-dehydrorhamnose 3,5-epimerase family protein n=1 Tax=Tenacibaculum sp. SG-28 TaxID=754426 RepID=UPI000CF43A0A|nr:dTDP-4-dehydrorhamnose 3,5-epimerase family protein [Tenacibaculum sp. SG-28]PQJ21106.1 dTDP-4-dehydrorhamnose 3,5-epimerase [Tenacibaculum sp. SG-28]